jgi:hypothetical protein
MPLDHYVSQVHLRRFYAPALDGKKMYAFRKSDGHAFICGAKDVCRLNEGNTNAYLPEPRLVEEFLKLIEPKYNSACTAFETGEITPDDVFIVAGFTAFVMSCSPTAIRLGVEPLLDSLALGAKLLDRAGQIPKAPSILGEKTLTELLADGSVTFEVDGKYPQALGINNIINSVTQYGNFHWDILINEHSDTPFFTTDFPVAVEPSHDLRIVNRIVPLTPSLAIRICPRIELSGRTLGPTFEHFSYRRLRPSRSEIVALNRAIVRCAETLVFSGLVAPWVAGFVRKHARFRVEIDTANIPDGKGFLSIVRTVVRERRT